MKLSEELILMAEWWSIPLSKKQNLRDMDKEFGEAFFDNIENYLQKEFGRMRFTNPKSMADRDEGYSANCWLCLLEAEYQKDIEAEETRINVYKSKGRTWDEVITSLN